MLSYNDPLMCNMYSCESYIHIDAHSSRCHSYSVSLEIWYTHSKCPRIHGSPSPILRRYHTGMLNALLFWFGVSKEWGVTFPATSNHTPRYSVPIHPSPSTTTRRHSAPLALTSSLVNISLNSLLTRVTCSCAMPPALAALRAPNNGRTGHARELSHCGKLPCCHVTSGHALGPRP